MEDPSDKSEQAPESKSPAPVTAPTKRLASKSPSKRAAGAKKAPAKKTSGAKKAASAKKTPVAKASPAMSAETSVPPSNVEAPTSGTTPPVSKAPAKKAPSMEASAAKKSVPAKKAASLKASAKKSAPAKKAPSAKKAPVAKKSSPAAKAALASKTTSAKQAPPKEPNKREDAPRVATHTASRSSTSARLAMCASVTEEMLNELVPFVVGEGIAIDPLDTAVLLPGIGKVDVRLGLKATSAVVGLGPENNGRIRITVHADGDVTTHGDAGQGAIDDSLGEPISVFAMPAMPPAPIPIIGEALVTPFFEIGSDGKLSVGLDFNSAELVSIRTDLEAPAPDGVDPLAWPGLLAMFGMVFGAIGDDLFASMREHVGSAKVDLDTDVGATLLKLGAAPGLASLSVSSGLLTLSLFGDSTLEGSALPVPIAGKRVGIGLAESGVNSLTDELLARLAGDMSLPVELDISLGEQHVGSRLRNTRLLPDTFPDLRSSLRTQIRTRLLRGRLEISVQAAWVEFPSAVPSLFNSLSKRIGGLVSLAPLKVKFPAVIRLPLPDTDDTIGIQVDDLRVTEDGIGLVVSLA